VLRFIEEIRLLQIDEKGKLVELPPTGRRCRLVGAVLMELALRNKVDTDNRAVLCCGARADGR
jgi:hypothetical protein